MKTGLLLVGIQKDYFKDGRKPLEHSESACVKAKQVLEAFRSHNLPVIHIQHICTRPNATYLLPCTKGIQFHDLMKPVDDELIIKKHYASAFHDTQLLDHLRKEKINHLVVCGMMTQTSIDATVKDASHLTIVCTVLSDACAAGTITFQGVTTSAKDVQHVFLGSIDQLYADVLTTDDVLITKQVVSEVA